MEAGQIVRAAVPQADRAMKARPVVLIKQFPPHGDWLVCGISKSVDSAVEGFDIVIDEAHPDYSSTRLAYPGVIRIGFLNAISRFEIEGAMGRVSPDTYALIIQRLINHLRSH